MFTTPQLIAHLVGDYILQSNWMAVNKTQASWVGRLAVVIHAAFYSLPFLLLTGSPAALAVICVAHAVIDHWRLAKYVVWLKNWLQLPWGSGQNSPWSKCKTLGVDDAFAKELTWLHGWLLILTDNLLHIVINGAAIWWLG